MHALRSEGAWWQLFVAAVLAASFTLSAEAHAAAKLHQQFLSTPKAHLCYADRPELCSTLPLGTLPASQLEKSAEHSETISKENTGESSTNPTLPGRGEWERCRSASSSLSSQRTLGPGVHSTSACSPSASPLPPVTRADVKRGTGAETVLPSGPVATAAAVGAQRTSGPTAHAKTGATSTADLPRSMSFMEALGRAAAAEAAALGGGVWDWNTWGVGAFHRGALVGDETRKDEGKEERSEENESFVVWGINWKNIVSDFFSKVDKRLTEANGMLHYTDLYGNML